jgi:hypothetical protein
MIPTAFRTLGALRVLNTLAIASALAASTGVAFLYTWGHMDLPRMIPASVLSTFAVGLLWARLLRSRRRVTRWQIQIGWVLSPALAVLNAALACGLLFAQGSHLHLGFRMISFLIGAVMGVTVGAMAWLPGWVVTMLCFGVPIMWAQRRADRGLAGEEQGERVVGLVAAAIGLLSALPQSERSGAGPLARLLLDGCSLAAIVTGASAAVLATARAMRRRVFVADAEAGRVPGYRVQTAPEGKVLVRVERSGEMYRGSEHFEAVVELDHEGEAKRALVS